MSREHPLALHRVVPVLVVVALAAAALLAVQGPTWYRRLDHPLRYAPAIAQSASADGLDPHLVAAVVNVESGFDPASVSPKGAVGLMQVMPATARQVGRELGIREKVTIETLKVPESNLRIGTRHLRTLTRHYGEDDVALAAYNAGSVAVDRWLAESRHTGTPFRDVVDFPATRHYIEEVLAQREVYSVLYPDAFTEAK
ncbi:MAG: lytic transglycosylase domain-containing protein [Coriobacteriia bacterium]|nr:lytic transglycosylase domain-containing protein [Coriobacteriia bacterium]